MFEHDFTDVNESGDFAPIPEGDYTLRIGEKIVRKSQKGYNQVLVELFVENGEYKGRKVFHTVTFLPTDNPGAGIAKRWLHAIGQEYEGKITVIPNEWRGLVKCTIQIEEYINKNGSQKKRNKISQVHIPDTNDVGSELDEVNFNEVNNESEKVPF